jgi:hypothetical protein
MFSAHSLHFTAAFARTAALEIAYDASRLTVTLCVH